MKVKIKVNKNKKFSISMSSIMMAFHNVLRHIMVRIIIYIHKAGTKKYYLCAAQLT